MSSCSNPLTFKTVAYSTHNLPDTIQQRFFAHNLPFLNSRYRHYDLATKFLYLEHSDDLTDLKKIRLDIFVKDFRGKKPEEAQTLVEACKRTTNQMSAVFVGNDPLLSSVGNDVLYYWLFRIATIENWSEKLSRQSFIKFEQVRKENRDTAEVDLSAANYNLMDSPYAKASATTSSPEAME